MKHKSRACLLTLIGVALLPACGGGGGSEGGSNGGPGGSGGGGGSNPPPGSEFSLSRSLLTFFAANPTAPTPGGTPVTATVTGTISGTLYILVEITGPAVTVSGVGVTGPNTGSATVNPVDPKSLGVGTFNSTVTVRACVNSPTCATGQLSGSPRTINVTYTIGSTFQRDSVSPRLVPANASGTVVLRGSGFSGVTGVTFGTTPATSFAVKSATEMVASYPALTQGAYPVTLVGGGNSFSSSLIVQDGEPFASADLTYPAPPEEIASILYDDERHAFFVATRYADRANNQVLRYGYSSGTWEAPTSTPIFDVRDIGLLQDGRTLLVLSGGSIRELDSTSFAPLHSSVNRANFLLSGSLEFMRSLAVGNDGNVVIASDCSGSGQGKLFLYSTGSREFFDLSRRDETNALIGGIYAGLLSASADGSRVLTHTGTLSTVGDLHALEYSPVSGLISRTTLSFDAGFGRFRPSLSRDGSRVVLSNGTTTQVFAADNSLYCWLPEDSRAYVASPDGSRVYVLDSQSQLSAFSINPGGGNCAQTGSAVVIPDPGVDSGVIPVGRVQMTISRDGRTLFIAGINGVFVRPVP